MHRRLFAPSPEFFFAVEIRCVGREENEFYASQGSATRRTCGWVRLAQLSCGTYREGVARRFGQRGVAPAQHHQGRATVITIYCVKGNRGALHQLPGPGGGPLVPGKEGSLDNAGRQRLNCKRYCQPCPC